MVSDGLQHNFEAFSDDTVECFSTAVRRLVPSSSILAIFASAVTWVVKVVFLSANESLQTSFLKNQTFKSMQDRGFVVEFTLNVHGT